jgi:hypothetical protein
VSARGGHPWGLYTSLLIALCAATLSFSAGPFLAPEPPRVQPWLADPGTAVTGDTGDETAACVSKEWGPNPFLTADEIEALGPAYAYVSGWAPPLRREASRLEALIRVEGRDAVALRGGEASGIGSRADARAELAGLDDVRVSVHDPALDVAEREARPVGRAPR